jgi:predicted nucleic acid-binding protein
MTDFIDTSVLVAAMVASEAHHEVCDELFDRGGIGIYAHALAEAFSTLTGGRRSVQMKADCAIQIIEEDYLPVLSVTSLTHQEMIRGMCEAQSRGVRGGAVFDYLHLMAARKAKAKRFYTLNISNFRAFHRTGDPEVVHPGE